MKKTAIVAIGTLLIALVLFISGTMMGGFNELQTLYDQGDFNVKLPFSKTMDVTEEFSNIRNLEIQAEAGTVEIIEYEGTVIKVEANNVSTKARIDTEHDTLIVKDTFRFWHLANVTNFTTKIKIYIPNNYEFDNVEFEVDAGDFTVPNIKAKRVEIDVDAGNFDATKIITSYIKVDVDAGDADIKLLDSYTSEFDVNAGDLDVTMLGSENDYSYNVKCDVGDVTIGGYRCDGISDKHSHHGGQRNIEADCDAGSITVNMEV